MTIRVLIQPMREFENRVGGGKVQLQETIAQLDPRDFQVDIRADPQADLSGYDLVHLYFPLQAGLAFEYLSNARRQAKPVVASPVYWNRERYFRETRRIVQETRLPALSPPMQELAHLEQDIAERQGRVGLLELRLVAAQAELLLPLSRLEAELLARDLDAAPHKMRVVPNGVSPAFDRADPEPFIGKFGVRDFVLCAARLDENKNQLSLLRALRAESLPVVVIGETASDWYGAACRDAANARTLFLDRVPQEVLAQAYAAARVHALVSWYECAPLSALEAGRAGCNLVLTVESAMREYCGDRAWYCDPSDLSSIRGAVLAAYAAPRRTELAEHLRAEFTWARSAAATACAYREAVERARSRPPSGEWLPEAAAAELIQELLALDAQREAYALLTARLNAELYRKTVALDGLIHQIEKGKVLRALRGLQRLRKPRPDGA